MLRHQEEEAKRDAAPQHRKGVDPRRGFRPPKGRLRPQPAQEAIQRIPCRMNEAADGQGKLQFTGIAKKQPWRHRCPVQNPAADHQRQRQRHLR